MTAFEPVWPVPAHVRAIVTTTTEGNLAMHVGDQVEASRNRLALVDQLGLPRMPRFMEQVHGADVFEPAPGEENVPSADAAVTQHRDLPIAVMVADCLPVLLADSNGSRVAVVHAGWRGLAGGVIANAVASFEAAELSAWLGPAIGPCHYEVDDHVRRHFKDDRGFEPVRPGHYMMDLYEVATRQLHAAGVGHVFGGDYCTWCDPRFYSHRENQAQARFAVIAWLGS